MGKLRIIKPGSMATIQDRGRFWLRKYGIPQSGAMDSQMMEFVNQCLGNEKNGPVIEFALLGIKLRAEEETLLAWAGCHAKINEVDSDNPSARLRHGDILELKPPTGVYGYLAIGGALKMKKVFDSYSTYLPGGFGGIKGRMLKAGDMLETEHTGELKEREPFKRDNPPVVRFIKGPEWQYLEDEFSGSCYQIDASSNRIGIRMKGSIIDCQLNEIKSSAVIPGVVQLPPNGQPVVLMNDCPTTGGYPRIGKVVDDDMGILSQIKPMQEVQFVLFD